MDDLEIILISSLNQYAYCPRRCALIHIEGVFEHNEHTVMGSQLHERTDRPGYEIGENIISLRALPLFSKRYGLVGKADVVEMQDHLPVPVEYKKGKRKKWDNDDIQLCAQALCLEEMFQADIPKGFIYHATSKRRREVVLDEALREKTLMTIKAVRDLVITSRVPAAILTARCDGCSLRPVCLPELADPGHRKSSNELWQD